MDNIKICYSAEQNLTIPMIKSGKTKQTGINLSDKYIQLARRIQKNEIHCFSSFSDDMPEKLESFRPSPHFIYAIGDVSLFSYPKIGIVGPRKNSSYADQVLQSFFEKAKQYNMVTVSGLARGVDALCHKYSIQNNIPTIAVLGGGLKRYAESRNRAQIEAIVNNGGLVLSEFKLELEPNKYTFPQRNRIIAGLSDVLFLPEANERSGSLITANHAVQYQKPIYVAPNSLFQETSRGTNSLLTKGGAKSVDGEFSFLDKYFSPYFDRNSFPGSGNISQVKDLSDNEQKIYNYISQNTDSDINMIVSYTQLETAQVLDIILLLELQGIIYEHAPNTYKICH